MKPPECAGAQQQYDVAAVRLEGIESALQGGMDLLGAQLHRASIGKPRHQHGLSGFGSIRASNLVARQAIEQAAVNTLDAGRNISVEDRRDVGPRRLADRERAKDRVRHRLSLRRAERDDAGDASSRTAH
jgi:hypothetical protein